MELEVHTGRKDEECETGVNNRTGTERLWNEGNV